MPVPVKTPMILGKQAEIRRVEPGEDQADDDLADHEGKEEQRLVEPDAGDGLVQEDRDDQPAGTASMIEHQPDDVVPERGVEGVVVSSST